MDVYYMELSPCPVCGNDSEPKWDSATLWCVPCVDRALAEQQRLRYAQEKHEIIAVRS